MTIPMISLQDLRRRIYHKAKSEKDWRFWGIYVHVCKMETLWEAYRMAKANDGAPGVDGVTFEAIECGGVEAFLCRIQEELMKQSYTPQPYRHVSIPKGDGKRMRKLSIPSIKERVVQGALRLILEPIFEADFCDNTFGYRPGRSCPEALYRVSGAVMKHGLREIVDVDLKDYFNNIRHHLLLAQVARRVRDDKVLWLLKRILKGHGRKGVPQGSPLSPLMANLYLAEVDRVFKEGEEKTCIGSHPRLSYTRVADDIVIAVGVHPRWPKLMEHTLRRLREELDKLEVSVNDEKTKVVDLTTGSSFTYLGFDCRLVKSRRGKLFLLQNPRLKKRKELVAKIRGVIRRSGRRTVKDMVEEINPILRGWVNYFRIGHSSRTFNYVKGYVEQQVRRFAMRRRLRRGFGWKRWSKWVVYGEWGLFNEYRVRYYCPPAESMFQLIGA